MIRYASILLFSSIFVASLSAGWDAEKYDRASDGQFNHGLKLLEQANLDPSAELSILDIGCGTCRLAAHMAKTFPNSSIIAIDNDENMIQKSKEKQAEDPLKNLEIIQMDARSLDFDDEQFDLAISVHCFHWFDNEEQLEACLKNIYQSLKPGGKLCAVFNIDHTDEHPIPTLKAAREFTEMPQWAPFYEGKKVLANCIPISVYQKILEQVGFSEGSAFIQHSGVLRLTKEQRMTSIFALPIGQAIPQESREAFSRDILEKLEEFGLKNDDGTYNQGLECGVIIVTK